MKRFLGHIKRAFSIPHELSDKKQEVLIEHGRREFKRLLEKGLAVPVAFL